MIAMILNGKTFIFSILTILGCHATFFSDRLIMIAPILKVVT
jgi:hypothetical protein